MITVRVGMGSCGLAAGAVGVHSAARAVVANLGLDAEIRTVGCMGLCHREVLVEVVTDHQPPALYGDLTPELARSVLHQHLSTGRPVTDALVTPDDASPERGGQVRIASRNCGRVDPTSIDDHRARGGYKALGVALALTPAEVRSRIELSGLRGRGGGGFNTGKKWSLAASSPDPTRYLICNADEGDPGAFMDRNLVEGDPHAIIEGMIIAAWAIGAHEGFVYIRYEYPLAVERMRVAIEQARGGGWLGDQVAGRDFRFDVHVRTGAGAFVCGEETALVASIEGHRGIPRLRPPYPTARGLHGHPTCINNVETFATIPWIIEHGPHAFRAHGTDASPGTKVFSLAGDIRRGGMIEVPLGVTLNHVVNVIGGGSPRPIKAVQVGGPSGGIVPARLLDTRLDYDALASLGAMLGSGGLIVMDERRCMVDVARYFTGFLRDESCGACTACREGTWHLYRTLDRICRGEGRPEDLDRVEDLAHHVTAGSICGLGKTAPAPLLTTLRYFRDEYEAHVMDHKCPAGVCKALIRYDIDRSNCDGCLACHRACPADAIDWDSRILPPSIDPERCVRCDACRQVCPYDVIKVVS